MPVYHILSDREHFPKLKLRVECDSMAFPGIFYTMPVSGGDIQRGQMRRQVGRLQVEGALVEKSQHGRASSGCIFANADSSWYGKQYVFFRYMLKVY
ncbi:hypothetical protein GWI33_021329 [Rhynchophorus ferrugineus]|uniref:Uncharacterized protein n=1 Tax=Rhynchophorus ferrugineus TaxID=354439 RepID=A0A834HMW5_RHYFE|nr:hypothetical protein GWI33_021329 [Rhynchophorus ferrugineus]